MERSIEITSRAVADYRFRQAMLLYGPDDLARHTALTEHETAILHATVLALLAQRPVPVQPKGIPAKQSRVEARISADG